MRKVVRHSDENSAKWLVEVNAVRHAVENLRKEGGLLAVQKLGVSFALPCHVDGTYDAKLGSCRCGTSDNVLGSGLRYRSPAATTSVAPIMKFTFEIVAPGPGFT
jgi:hypothetical protein